MPDESRSALGATDPCFAEPNDGPFEFGRVVCAELAQIRPESELAKGLPCCKEHDLKTQLSSAWTNFSRWLTKIRRSPQQKSSMALTRLEADAVASEKARPWKRTDFGKELFECNLTALCLSGGGIRSATICLGVIQALAKEGLLTKFDYLSTVSGGGYIGSWLSAWATREGNGVSCAKGTSTDEPKDDGGFTGMEKVAAKLASPDEPREVGKLREYSNYLTPRAGLMSGDTWAGVAVVARNLILNWLLFLPLFLLLVWIPKFATLVSNAAHLEFNGGVVSAETLLLFAAIVYAAAEHVVGKQLVILQAQKFKESLRRERKGVASRKADEEPSTSIIPRDIDEVEHFLLVLAPTAFAACLASAALPYIIVQTCANEMSQLLWFAIGGASLWALPLALAILISLFRRDWDAAAKTEVSTPDHSSDAAMYWRELPMMLLARFLAGVVFGVVLLMLFRLGLTMADGDHRYAVVLGVSACFLAHLAGGIAFAGFNSRSSNLDDLLEWGARSSGWFLVVGLVWTVYAVLVLWDPEHDWPQIDVKDWLGGQADALIASLGGVTGLAAALFGHSRWTASGQKNAVGKSELNWSRVAVAGALLFSVALLFELSRLMDRVLLKESFVTFVLQGEIYPGLKLFAWAFAFLAAWLVAASCFINVNKFSLHAYYRNRLIRAYLGASNIWRRPNPFTGFDQDDNIPMSELAGGRPLHIVNTALNIVHGESLAWQERKASSYSISRVAVGDQEVSYRPADRYGRSISLGTAMAISGAAVSPNMGYNSSPVLTFIMTLFNARLGWWLGNPLQSNWTGAGPKLALWPFIVELFGLTNTRRQYVYLSDGGHFENLGVYEMLRRRCRTIVVVDAGCDPEMKFADLGNLIRKARIDLGVEIAYYGPRPPYTGSDPMRLGLVNRPHAPGCAPYCAIGTISYPDTDAMGMLIYIKAAIHGDEPEDVWGYAAVHEEFPHESTADQFFSESQFESYRRLGFHIGSTIFAGPGEPRSASIDLEKRAIEHCRKCGDRSLA